MNLMINTLKKQGIKAALPLLLLATACGEGTPTASADVNAVPSSDLAAEVTASETNAFAGLSDMEAPAPPENVLPDTDKAEETDTVMAQAKNAAFAPTATKVPEPATLTGLAVAALGLGAVKRKRAAA